MRFYAGRALHLLVKDRPELMIAPDRVWRAVNCELSLQRSVWANHRLLDRRGSDEKSGSSTTSSSIAPTGISNTVFTLLGLLLPGDAVRIAFRALHTDDLRNLRAPPSSIWKVQRRPIRVSSCSHYSKQMRKVDDDPRMRSAHFAICWPAKARVNTNLNLKPIESALLTHFVDLRARDAPDVKSHDAPGVSAEWA